MGKTINKIKDNYEKYHKVYVFILFMFLLAGSEFTRYVRANDELWNFQSIYKMYNGFTLYKDVNVIITPLFFTIGNGIFHLLGANVFIFRVYNMLIFGALYLSIYILFKILNMSKTKALINTLIVSLLCKDLVSGGANYNILVMVFVIIGIIDILRREKHILVQGIIIFLLFITKQNVAVCYAMGFILYEFWANKENHHKIKTIVISFTTTIILLIPLTIYSAVIGNFKDFIDYAFLGMNEFTNKNMSAYFSYFCIFIGVILGIITTSIVLLKTKKTNLRREDSKNMRTLASFGVSMLLIAFPIFNIYHMLLSVLISVLFLLYILEVLILRQIVEEKIMQKALKILIPIIIIVCIVFPFIRYKKMPDRIFNKGVTYNNPYWGAPMEEELRKNIETITKYIIDNNNKVIVLSHKAALYAIPLKMSNGAMDLPFSGNMGSGGEDGMIKKLSEQGGFKILITTNGKFWQESDKVIDYVKTNFKHSGEIEEFSIYETYGKTLIKD